MIERSESGAMVTGSSIELYKVMTLRRGLILKIDTGMQLTRVSCLKVAQRDGYTSARSYRKALKDVNQWLTDHGVAPKWSTTYPEG